MLASLTCIQFKQTVRTPQNVTNMLLSSLNSYGLNKKNLEECCIYIVYCDYASVMLGIKSGVANLLKVFTQVIVLTDQNWRER
jgi:hypothetical protein